MKNFRWFCGPLLKGQRQRGGAAEAIRNAVPCNLYAPKRIFQIIMESNSPRLFTLARIDSVCSSTRICTSVLHVCTRRIICLSKRIFTLKRNLNNWNFIFAQRLSGVALCRMCRNRWRSRRFAISLVIIRLQRYMQIDGRCDDFRTRWKAQISGSCFDVGRKVSSSLFFRPIDPNK